MGLMLRSGIFVAMTSVTVFCCYYFSNPSTDPSAGIVVWLPDEVPGYEIEMGNMGEMERKWLPIDTTYLKKTYREAGLSDNLANYRALHATLIVAGSDSRSLHRPQVCLTAQGWGIGKREVVSLQTKGGPLQVMNFHLDRLLRNEDGSLRRDEKGQEIRQRAYYCYWWVGPKDSTPYDEQKVWLSVRNSIIAGRNERWAYPSAMVYVDERFPEKGPEEAKKRVYAFIQSYAPAFQKSLGAEDREDALELRDL